MSEPTKPHRPGSMSDDDRALVGRKHTSPIHVPEVVDEEATPLPQEPPSPELVSGYDDLSPTLKKILVDQHNTLREHDVAIGRVWPARHVEVRITQLSAELQAIARALVPLANVPAALQSQKVLISEIQRRTAAMTAAATKLETAIAGLNAELGELRLEREREKHAREMLEARVTNEIKAVKERLETADERAAKDSARIASLESDRVKVKAWAALIGLLAGVGAWLVTRLGFGK